MISIGPSDTTPPTSQGSGNPSDFPPSFDCVVERMNSSGAPDAVKEQILDRIVILRAKSGCFETLESEVDSLLAEIDEVDTIESVSAGILSD